MSSFLAGPIGLAYHIVLWLAQILTPLTGGIATTAAIVAFTIGVRLLLAPLSFYALRGQARIAAVQPRAEELRTRYARQPDRLQAELGALYAREAGGMLAGCLPLLLQLPFFSVMYRLFLSGSVGGHPNALLTKTLLGTPLGSHLLSQATLTSAHGLVFVGLLALLGLAGTLSVRVARATAPAPGSQQAAVLGFMTRLLPYLTLVIAAFVPLAAGIYLLTTTTWTLFERSVLRRWTPPVTSPAAAVSPAGHAR